MVEAWKELDVRVWSGNLSERVLLRVEFWNEE